MYLYVIRHGQTDWNIQKKLLSREDLDLNATGVEQCIEAEKLDAISQRCIGQQIVSNPNDCPSSITCPKKEQVVCPTGECVDNEIECPRLTRCNDKYPYLCQNDVCAKSYESCPLSISCGENRILCPDNICRERC